MAKYNKSNIITTGLAMFSMFFGAGNIVFPLALGQLAGDKTLYGILGLLVTGVGVPFAGLLAMVLFEGSYRKFFDMIGKLPGFVIITFLMILNGPLGAIPRCISLPYFAMKQYFPGITLFYFSLFLCILIYFLTIKKNKVVGLLGKILSPALLIILGTMIIKGLISHPCAIPSSCDTWQLFCTGLNEGYLTMDLLGALFFSGIAFASLKKAMGKEDNPSCPKLMKFSLKACLVGATLLSFTYIGFSYLAAFHGGGLDSLIDKDQLLTVIASRILGSSARFFADIAVLFACLTTALTLIVVFAEFLRKEICKKTINYNLSLLITLVSTFIVSNMGFMGIINMISPILLIVYPVLIVLTIFNIFNKLFGITFVKVPVIVTCLILLLSYVSR